MITQKYIKNHNRKFIANAPVILDTEAYIDEGGFIEPLASPLVVSLNDTVRMIMRIQNTFGTAIIRDLGAAYGRIRPDSGFEPAFGCLRRDVSIGVGITEQFVDCKATVLGTGFDTVAQILRREHERWFFEALLGKKNQLTVAGFLILDTGLIRV